MCRLMLRLSRNSSVGNKSRCPVLLTDDLSGLQHKALTRISECRVYARGYTRGRQAPLVGGAAASMRASSFLLARSVLPAWGEPARPGLPPEGETGRGRSNSLLPQADSFMLPVVAWSPGRPVRPRY